VIVRIGDRNLTIRPGGTVSTDLLANQALKVLVERPDRTFPAPEFLLIDSSGGDVRIQLEGDNSSFTYETPSERQLRMKIATQEMIFVHGGTFTMGCTFEQGGECDDDERPARQVTVSDFHIGKYEVTQAQWRGVMGNNPSNFSGCDQCPVEYVSWNDVQEFISKLNAMTGKRYRLPTEAEWEYAARGGSQSRGYKYSGSSNVGSVAWYDGNSGDKTHSVGQKSPNELGLYDMSGNVWEWCQDWYGNYSSGSQTNPRGPSSGSIRVNRGGSWSYDARGTRVSNRYSDSPGIRSYLLGFRLAL
jgi:formylglycine-generating enzyme required for sulfatase activity